MTKFFMKWILSIIFFTCSFNVISQTTDWEKNYSDKSLSEFLTYSIKINPNLLVHASSALDRTLLYSYPSLLFMNAAGDSLLNKKFTSFYDGRFSGIANNNDGTFVISGYYTDTINNLPVGFLIKTDTLGNVIWQQNLGQFVEFKVLKLPDGYFLIAKNGFSLIKTDLQGQLIWQRTYSNTSAGMDIIPLTDGSYLSLNYENDINSTTPNSYYRFNIWLLKLRPNGDTIVSRILGSPVSYEIGNQIKQTQDGGFIISGAYVKDTIGTIREGMLIKLDSLFNFEWEYKLISPVGSMYTGCEFFTVDETIPGNFVISGNWIGVNYRQNGYAALINSNGNVIWSQLYDTSRTNTTNKFNKVVYNSNGSAVFCGNGGKVLNDIGNYFVKISGLGQPFVQNFCTFPPRAQFSFQQQPDSLIFTDASISGTRYGIVSKWEWSFGDGNSFVTYDSLEARRVAHKYTLSASQLYGKAVTLVVTNNLGCTDSVQLYPFGGGPTGLEEEQSLAGITLYPNPATNQVNIMLPQEYGSIMFYDVSGRKLLNQKLQQKQNQVDISSLPKGMYFYRVFMENGVKTGKLVKQ